ncbi:MAG: PTS sugar transporter subunit IIA [Desulfobacteraceae bacterium]|nr:MAG: PTS sugar transporter subunit IIA [Desulfobacteraceae bacterium]
MRLRDYLDEHRIFLNLEAKDKGVVFEKIVALMVQNQVQRNSRDFLAALRHRESLGSTTINDGMALLHARRKDFDKLLKAGSPAEFIKIMDEIECGLK